MSDGTWNEGQESVVSTPQHRLVLAVLTLDSVPLVLMPCLALRVWMPVVVFGPFLDVDDDGDGQYDLNPAGEAFSCNDPNRDHLCSR